MSQAIVVVLPEEILEVRVEQWDPGIATRPTWHQIQAEGRELLGHVLPTRSACLAGEHDVLQGARYAIVVGRACET